MFFFTKYPRFWNLKSDFFPIEKSFSQIFENWICLFHLKFISIKRKKNRRTFLDHSSSSSSFRLVERDVYVGDGLGGTRQSGLSLSNFFFFFLSFFFHFFYIFLFLFFSFLSFSFFSFSLFSFPIFLFFFFLSYTRLRHKTCKTSRRGLLDCFASIFFFCLFFLFSFVSFSFSLFF